VSPHPSQLPSRKTQRGNILPPVLHTFFFSTQRFLQNLSLTRGLFSISICWMAAISLVFFLPDFPPLFFLNPGFFPILSRPVTYAPLFFPCPPACHPIRFLLTVPKISSSCVRFPLPSPSFYMPSITPSFLLQTPPREPILPSFPFPSPSGRSSSLPLLAPPPSLPLSRISRCSRHLSPFGFSCEPVLFPLREL